MPQALSLRPASERLLKFSISDSDIFNKTNNSSKSLTLNHQKNKLIKIDKTIVKKEWLMNLMIKKRVRRVHRAVCVALAGMLMVVLTGCQTLGGAAIPAAEYENFTPKSPEKRIMKEVSVRWEIRNDVAQYCARSIGMGREQAYFTPPVACAVWQVDKKECVIVTGSPTSHVALGHELRHCFEGHFH